MKNVFSVVILAISLISAASVNAADKVVVIPLASDNSPGDWTTISVSSLAGVPRNSSTSTIEGSHCTEHGTEKPSGRRGQSGGPDYLAVPIQLPDGATITSFTGVICDNTSLGGGDMILSRAVCCDEGTIARVSTSPGEKSTTVFTRTTTSIAPGMAVVDNSKYSYVVYMLVSSGDGNDLIPIRGIVTLR